MEQPSANNEHFNLTRLRKVLASENQTYFFTNGDLIHGLHEAQLPKEIIDDIILSRAIYCLASLQEGLKKYEADASPENLDNLVEIIGHRVSKIGGELVEEQQLTDLGVAFEKCHSMAINSYESGATERVIQAAKNVVEKFGADKRFAVDPYALKEQVALQLSSI